MVEKYAIELNSIDKVKCFVNEINTLDGEFDLVSGKYIIDAKSIMGIFSLDLSKPLELRAEMEDKEQIKKLEKYMIK